MEVAARTRRTTSSSLRREPKAQEEDGKRSGRASNKGGCYFRMKDRGRPWLSLSQEKIKPAEDSDGLPGRLGEGGGLHW